jgi:uncharacterized membrane protein
MSFVSAWFLGEARLWKPFWLGGVLVGFLVSLAMSLLALAGIVGSVASFVLAAAYGIWLAVAIWNCAYNVDWEWWGHIARAYMIAVIAMVVGNIIFFPLFL